MSVLNGVRASGVGGSPVRVRAASLALLVGGLIGVVPVLVIMVLRPSGAVESANSGDPVAWATVALMGVVPSLALWGRSMLAAGRRASLGAWAAAAFLVAAVTDVAVVVSTDLARPDDATRLLLVAALADAIVACVASFLPIRRPHSGQH